MSNHCPRRMLQLSLKSLFLLTLVVAAFFAGYSLGARNTEEAAQREEAALKKARDFSTYATKCEGAVSAMQYAIEQAGYGAFWTGDLTRVLIRAPNGTETVYHVRDFGHPNPTSK
jgi:outer membrane lipoprotein-sorting protein